MPDVELKQRAIARSINVDWAAKDLQEHWQSVKSAVRSLHQKIFYRPLLVAVSKADGGLVLSSEQVLDRLSAIGLTATCNPMGAGKWQGPYSQAFRGASLVVVIADKDEVGRAHAKDVQRSDRKSTRLNSSHIPLSRMPSSA